MIICNTWSWVSFKYLALPNYCLCSSIPMPKKYLFKQFQSKQGTFEPCLHWMMTKLFYRAIFGARYNVAVACVVALTPEQVFWFVIVTNTNTSGTILLKWWPGEAGNHPIVAKDDLGDLGSLGGKDAEGVVPEPSGNHKPCKIRASMCEEWI